jgi:hypothetical protein
MLHFERNRDAVTAAEAQRFLDTPALQLGAGIPAQNLALSVHRAGIPRQRAPLPLWFSGERCPQSRVTSYRSADGDLIGIITPHRAKAQGEPRSASRPSQKTDWDSGTLRASHALGP